MNYHPYADHLNELITANNFNYFVVDSGVNGETTTAMRERLVAELNKRRYEACIIMGGTNDLGRWEPGVIAQGNLKFLHETALKSVKYTISMTVPCATLDSKTESEQYGKYQENKKNLNVLIKKMAEENDRIGLVDLYEEMHVDKYEDLKMVWDDRLHFTPFGYDQIAELVFPKLKSLLEK
jgi:lysophospholipase L1-like esterase